MRQFKLLCFDSLHIPDPNNHVGSGISRVITTIYSLSITWVIVYLTLFTGQSMLLCFFWLSCVQSRLLSCVQSRLCHLVIATHSSPLLTLFYDWHISFQPLLIASSSPHGIKHAIFFFFLFFCQSFLYLSPSSSAPSSSSVCVECLLPVAFLPCFTSMPILLWFPLCQAIFVKQSGPHLQSQLLSLMNQGDCEMLKPPYFFCWNRFINAPVKFISVSAGPIWSGAVFSALPVRW